LSKITFDDGRSSIEFKAPSDRYLVINRLPPASRQEHPDHDNDSNPTPSPPNCALNPPLHWHSKQDEFFHVLEGQATFYLGGRKKAAVAGDVVIIPEGQFHTFRNASHQDELVVEFVLEPRDRVRDEQFFRNTQTYRDDCRKAGMPRSLFQVLIFNQRANVILALPGPEFIAKPMGRLLTFVGALVGKWIFGFHDSYAEYYAGKKAALR